jgi:hypothetical protein
MPAGSGFNANLYVGENNICCYLSGDEGECGQSSICRPFFCSVIIKSMYRERGNCCVRVFNLCSYNAYTYIYVLQHLLPSVLAK